MLFKSIFSLASQMGDTNDSAPFQRFNIDVNLLLIPGILLVIFVGKDCFMMINVL